MRGKASGAGGLGASLWDRRPIFASTETLAGLVRAGHDQHGGQHGGLALARRWANPPTRIRSFPSCGDRTRAAPARSRLSVSLPVGGLGDAFPLGPPRRGATRAGACTWTRVPSHSVTANGPCGDHPCRRRSLAIRLFLLLAIPSTARPAPVGGNPFGAGRRGRG